MIEGDMMNPEKVGQFIKKIRKDNNLTQQELADKYGVTYQAVSKWERGINLPEVSLIRQISKDFNISVEDILDGELSAKNEKSNKILLIIIPVFLILIVMLIAISKSHTFHFKTLSSTCDEFKVSGSIAYDKNKSSIYISNINYCGGDDNTTYKEIECNLYETNDNVNTKISSCKSDNNETLESYLKEIELNIDNYKQTCKNYNDDSLYLEINAKDQNDKTITYKIPLNLNNNCPN